MSLACRDLTPETWTAWEAMMAAHGGVFGGCWCIGFHPEGRQVGGYEARRAVKRAMVEAGTTLGALVFDGEACVGGVQYGRTPTLPAIKNRKAYEAGRGGEAPPDWRITCFFIDKRHRRQGVAALALDGALAAIAAAGGGVVEGYPERIEGQKTAAAFLHGGTVTMFERAGFEITRQIGLHMWVARRAIAAT